MLWRCWFRVPCRRARPSKACNLPGDLSTLTSAAPVRNALAHYVAFFTLSLRAFLPFDPRPRCRRAVELLNIRKIALQAPMPIDEFLAHAPDFFEDGIRHN